MENMSCAVCNSPAPHTCSGCQGIRYCSKEHQKAHWRDHKPNCGPYKLEWDVQVGQHLVARRNIKQGNNVKNSVYKAFFVKMSLLKPFR